jgi:hypothetical protein
MNHQTCTCARMSNVVASLTSVNFDCMDAICLSLVVALPLLHKFLGLPPMRTVLKAMMKVNESWLGHLTGFC